MKLVSFDIEIASVIPPHIRDWADQPNLGISCAAVALSDTEEISIWRNDKRLTREEGQELLYDLRRLSDAGYTIVTWNGCSFDFRILAEESGMRAEASQLAREHVDLMLMVTFTKGWFLSLEKALQGAGLGGKLKSVSLSDGTVLRGMDGSKAPELWSKGEYDAVIEYLKQDVAQQLALAQSVARNRRISWTSGSGNPQSVGFRNLLTVEECFSIPEPDTSWMSDPPSRSQFVSWMS